MSDSGQEQAAQPRKLLCKMYAYHKCPQTYDLDQVQEWKDHVVAHYHDKMETALERTIPCWIKDCDTMIIADTAGEKKAQFLKMMDHVHGHMAREDVEYGDLRSDEHLTILFLWEDIKKFFEVDSDFLYEEIQEMYSKHMCPAGENWEFWRKDAKEPPKAGEATVQRSDLHVHDLRREDRERRRLLREEKGKGKAVDRGGSGNQGGGGTA